MPQLDFKEIPQANLSNGEQDTFEMFAREFLELLGYEILSGPDRGSDLGRDLIVQEIRTGVGGETHIKWLVSCKHKAHSGMSVVLNDEQDIFDRVQTHGCIGFIGIKNNHPTFESQLFDKEKIENALLSTGLGQGIAWRFFPESYGKWSKQNFDLSLAMARFGMPQPVTYKMPNDDKILTLEEVLKLYPQGNQYMWDVFFPQNFILCNNILGITKIVEKDKLVDPPIDYVERRIERINFEIEYMRQQHLEEDKEINKNLAKRKSKISNSSNPNKASKSKMSKESRKRNRK